MRNDRIIFLCDLAGVEPNKQKRDLLFAEILNLLAERQSITHSQTSHLRPVYLKKKHASNADWRTLYRAAIHERNRNLILQRISTAETVALTRQRELFYQGGTVEEKESLEDALYALRAFRTAMQNAMVEAA